MILSADPRRRRQLVVLTLVLVLVIGTVDFFIGFELSLLVFYILPVCLAVAAVGWRFGTIMAIFCIASWLVGDFAAGARFSSPAVPFWNALFALGTYLVVIWMFQLVLGLQREMEARVRQRTLALTKVIVERQRLEKAILEISERERRKIGRDLHDDLGQHLTGTAFAGHVLSDKLHEKNLAEENDARQIVELIEDGIEKTRRLARGLLLAEIKRTGLISALQELAVEISSQFRVRCEFICSDPELKLVDDDCATHLFRIAQEAVGNAIRHGKAPRIVIHLAVDREVELRVHDYGFGLRTERTDGLGLRIMAHRAEIIGGRFAIGPHMDGGTVVTCVLPSSSIAHE